MVTLLLVVIIALGKLNTTNNLKFETELRHYQAQQQAIVQILNSAYQRALSLHDMSITQDPFAKDATFIRFREFGQKLIYYREYLSATNTTEEEWQLWRDIRDTLNNGGSLQYRIIDAIESDNTDMVKTLLLQELQPLQHHLQELLQKLSQIKESKLASYQSTLKHTDTNVTVLMYVLGLVAGILGIFTTIWIRGSTQVERELSEKAEQYKALYQLSALPDISVHEQINETMRLLCRYLDMDSAKLGRVDLRRRDLTYVEIVDFAGSLTEMEKNNVVSMDKTMSGLSVEKSDPILVQNVSQSIYANSQFFESVNTGSFIGIGLTVAGQIWGSLSFFRHQPRKSGFSKSEIQVLDIVGKWISVALQMQSSMRLQIENKASEKTANFETRFYSNINHELRTPLNAVIGYAELLMAHDDFAKSKRDEILLKIRQSGHHLLSLVDNILDLTKLEIGKVNLSIENFSVMDSVNAVVESLDYVFLQTETKLICSQYLGEMHSDKEKFQQILQNLIENICHYSKESEITMKITDTKLNGVDAIACSINGSRGLQNLANKLVDIVNESARRHWDYGRMEMGFSLCHRFSKILGGNMSVTESGNNVIVFHLVLPKTLSDSGAEAPPSIASVG